tara:strand:- start:1169 stop:1888 length:720 start_codon:yes stop_codon:yes gene_type:complete
MLNLILGSLGTAILSTVYITAIGIGISMRHEFMRYPWAVCGMVVNGAVGTIGFALYVFFIPIAQQPTETKDVVACTDASADAAGNCSATQNRIVQYAIVSAFRFVFWYSEFLVSFLYVAFWGRYQYVMVIAHYTAHFLNLTFSLVTLVLVLSPDFPSHHIPGYSAIAPVVIQSVTFMWVIMEFWCIGKSNLYTLNTGHVLSLHIIRTTQQHCVAGASAPAPLVQVTAIQPARAHAATRT